MSINVMSFRNSTGSTAREPAAVFDTADEFVEWTQNCLPGAVELTVVVVEGGNEEVTPESPERSGNTVTVPLVAGVSYSPSTGVHEISEDETLEVTATPDVGFEFPDDATTSWEFEYDSEDS